MGCLFLDAVIVAYWQKRLAIYGKVPSCGRSWNQRQDGCWPGMALCCWLSNGLLLVLCYGLGYDPGHVGGISLRQLQCGSWASAVVAPAVLSARAPWAGPGMAASKSRTVLLSHVRLVMDKHAKTRFEAVLRPPMSGLEKYRGCRIH
jgi:hypothetical protein